MTKGKKNQGKGCLTMNSVGKEALRDAFIYLRIRREENDDRR